MDLAISRVLLAEMRRAAAASPGSEICGLLLGRDNMVETIRPCANIAADPRDSFEIDPAALIAAHRAARSGGPALLGHYHSHPGGSAAPSGRDAAMSEAGSYWIIVAGQEVRCWLAAEAGRFIPVELVEPAYR